MTNSITEHAIRVEQKEIIAALNWLRDNKGVSEAASGAARVLAAIEEDRLYGAQYLQEDVEFENEVQDEVTVPKCACFYGHLLDMNQYVDYNYKDKLLLELGEWVRTNEDGDVTNLSNLENFILDVTPLSYDEQKATASELIKQTILDWLETNNE